MAVTKTIEQVNADTSKSSSDTKLSFGATEAEQSQYMGKVRSNRFSVNSALSEYDAAVKRSKLYGGSGSTASAVKNAEDRLRDMGLTEGDVSEWAGASPTNKAAVSNKLEAKRSAMRGNEAMTPDNMRYERGQWVTDAKAKESAAKPASAFRGFVSETHRQQMSGSASPVKMNFVKPGEDRADGEDVGFFDSFSSLLKDGTEVSRSGEGEYLLTGKALQTLRESGAVDPKQFSEEAFAGSYGARMKVSAAGKGFSAEFTPVTSDVVVEGSQQSMVDSAYGQYAKRMATELGAFNDMSQASGVNKKAATTRINSRLKGLGFSLSDDMSLSFIGQ